MLLSMMKGKLHRATVTATNADYIGSIAIADDLLKAANILPYEQVDVLNISNGERFTTYAISAPAGTGTIGVQGAAAHKAKAGDKVIIVAYAHMKERAARKFKPTTVLLNDGNVIASKEELKKAVLLAGSAKPVKQKPTVKKKTK